MVVAIARSAASRRVVAAAASQATKQSTRKFGAGAPKPEWTGIDKVVRSYFPEDYQLAGAVLGGYGVLISLAVLRSKLKSSPPPVEEAPKVAAVVVSSGGGGIIPPVESDDFEPFLKNEESLTKFLESEDLMMKWVETLSQE